MTSAEMTLKPTYTYRQLAGKDTLRVLRLYGSTQPDSIIACDLVETSLSSASLPYEAISYSWDDQTPSQTVLCEGHPLLVTPNCESALRCFRPSSDSETRFLWIDSLCINQRDDLEKSHQVGIMGSIYNQAKRVLIWLGEAKDCGPHSPRETFAWLVELAEAAEDPDRKARERKVLDLTFRIHTTDLNEFVTSVRWFKRLWIVQEVILAGEATLVYGHSQASLGAVMNARTILKTLDKGDGADRAGAGATYMALWNAFAVHDLGRCLMDASRNIGHLSDTALCRFMAEVRFSDASDNRDKILALHEILSHSRVPLPSPDYTKSVGTIYREAAVAMIRATNSLRLLELVDNLTSTPGLPSWAPDWSSSKHSIGQEDQNCLLAPLSEPRFTISDCGNRLTLKGIIIDTIVSRSSHVSMHVDERLGAPENYTRWTKNPPVVEAWWKDLLDTAPEYSSTILRVWNIKALQDFVSVVLGCAPAEAPEDRVRALYYTLMSQTRRTIAEDSEDKARAWFFTLCSPPASATPEHEDADEESDPTSQPTNTTWLRNRRYIPQLSPSTPIMRQLAQTREWSILQRVASNPTFDTFHSRIDRLRYKTVFMTEKGGKVGLAPWSVRVGDAVAWVAGVRVPMVVRRVGKGSSGEEFKLVGQAYVEGMMFGEGWPGDEEGGLREMCFV